MNNPDREQQKQVNDYFQSTLAYWDEIYREGGVYQTIYQRRRTVALSLVDKLALPAGSRVLEVGCAHGLTTVALAERGFFVEAVDAVPEMISAARIRAQESGLAQRMSFQVADIQNLPFEAGRFNLVLVIGVTEWLRSLEQPLREIERVLRPGGHLVIAADNRYALANMLDPLRNPVGVYLKGILQALLRRFGYRRRSPPERSYSIRQFDSFLRAAGLTKAEGKTVGFGPFSFCRRPLLAENTGLKLDQSLQRLADSSLPLLRSSGYVYIVLAVK
jgi:ubiquinone/menaquinone biosynthesis C-methylase UbiE